MKFKTVCLVGIFIAMVGLPLVSAAWKDYPYLYSVTWPKGTHENGDELCFTAWVKNPNSKNHDCKLRLVITYPDGTTKESLAEKVSVSPNEKAKVNIYWDVGHFRPCPPGTYKACISITPKPSSGGSQICSSRAFKIA